MTATRTQYRALCSVCFNQQAVDSHGFIAKHGYTVQHGFFSGTCPGAGFRHFGTADGRDNTLRVAEDCEANARIADANAEAIRTGTVEVTEWDRKTCSTVVVTSPLRIERAINESVRRASGLRLAAKCLRERAANWTEIAPVAVLVEAAKPALLHAHSKGWGRMCAGSLSAAHKGLTTSNHDAVTCPKCREALERQARAAAERAARTAA